MSRHFKPKANPIDWARAEALHRGEEPEPTDPAPVTPSDRPSNGQLLAAFAVELQARIATFTEANGREPSHDEVQVIKEGLRADRTDLALR
jgi:hypothetical protein